MASKYTPLAEHLKRLPGNEVTLSFNEIEEILGKPLPETAFRNTSFWSNQKSPWAVQAAQGWMRAGWKVAPSGVVHTVTFWRDA